MYRILDEQADKLRILSRKAEEVALFQVPRHQGVADILSFFQKFLIYFCPDFDIGCFKAVGSEQYEMATFWFLNTLWFPQATCSITPSFPLLYERKTIRARNCSNLLKGGSSLKDHNGAKKFVRSLIYIYLIHNGIKNKLSFEMEPPLHKVQVF